MFLNLERLLKNDNDKDFYRLFFLVICFINIVFHYLFLTYAPQSFDPVKIRLICSACCVFAFLASFLDDKIYKPFAYFTLGLFLGINNFYLLGNNNFTGEYFLGSLVTLLLLSFLCRRFYELSILLIVNALGFICAFSLTAKTVGEVVVMMVCIVLFSALTCLLFMFRRSYILRYIYIRGELISKDEVLVKTRQRLESDTAKLQGLIAGNTNLIFEFNNEKNCTHVWCPEGNPLAVPAEDFTGKNVQQLDIAPLNSKLKIAIKTLEPVSFEFQSLFGNELCYQAVIAPVFNDEKLFSGNFTLTITDITDIKLIASTLKESELILFNEQIVAKIGSWWTDESSKDMTWSNNLFSILEVTSVPAGSSKLKYYISLIHPNDRQRAQDYFDQLAHNPLIEFNHRLITPKGNLKYFKIVSGYPVINDEGRVLKVAGIVQDVTDNVTANKVIKKNQDELMEVQSIAKIGWWKWDVTMNNLTWSDELYRIYELVKEDVKHEDHFNLLFSLVHPDDRPLVSSVFKAGSKISQSIIEYRIITREGYQKSISMIIGKKVVVDNVIKTVTGTLQDQTDRKKTGSDVERTGNKYKNVLENISLAAITLNKAGEIVFCNKCVAEIVGYDKAELTGMNWIENFVPENLQEQFRQSLEHDSFFSQHTSPIVCRNGKQRVVNWKNTVTHDGFGNITETTSIGEDITDIKKAREALIIAKENAEKSSRFKSEFLSIMSHEIRTPMNAVIGTTNLLLQDNPAPRQLEYLNTLRFSSNNLLELINDILDYNKIEAGKLELYKTPFNLHKLAQNILQSFQNKAESNGSNLELQVDETIPANLIGDQLRLGQVLNNLLSNAVKFTKQGAIVLALETEKNRHDKVTIKFTISDTGIGIAEENLDKIFDPFTQEYQSTQSDYGGTGLGLAITKRLIELHNSTINLISSPGNGTEFSFSIEFDKAHVPDMPVEQGAGTAINSGFGHVKGMNVLLVDDNKMNLLIATKFLKNWQANVKQASNGQMAVELAMQNNYDLIIMDLQMPFMDGFEAASIIKQTQPDIPIIALSADAMPETSMKAAQYGMDDYLTKPFVPETLFEKIAKYYKPTLVGKW